MVHGLRWTDDGWLAGARAWIEAQLRDLGIVPAGHAEQAHVQPWSTVLRVPTDAGDLWFKANMPALSHEAAVIEVLAGLPPVRVPELLAVDRRSGWMLQADGGVRLRELPAGHASSSRWEQALATYAELQLDAAAERAALLAAGAPDHGLQALPGEYERLLDDSRAVAEELPGGLTGGEVQRLRELVPAVTRMCQGLAGGGLPETIQHDDFHDGQIFVRNGRCLVFDWADACVSHPFLTLTVTIRVLAHRLDRAVPELDRFRDAYLEPWTSLQPRRELLAALPDALRLGGICRALTWRRVVVDLPAPLRHEHADAVPGWLRVFLESAR
ncbi:MAG: phosphotransferase [Gaiellales bacterium]